MTSRTLKEGSRYEGTSATLGSSCGLVLILWGKSSAGGALADSTSSDAGLQTEARLNQESAESRRRPDQAQDRDVSLVQPRCHAPMKMEMSQDVVP